MQSAKSVFCDFFYGGLFVAFSLHAILGLSEFMGCFDVRLSQPLHSSMKQLSKTPGVPVSERFLFSYTSHESKSHAEVDDYLFFWTLCSPTNLETINFLLTLFIVFEALGFPWRIARRKREMAIIVRGLITVKAPQKEQSYAHCLGSRVENFAIAFVRQLIL